MRRGRNPLVPGGRGPIVPEGEDRGGTRGLLDCGPDSTLPRCSDSTVRSRIIPGCCARFAGASCAPVIRLSRANATISGASDLGQTQYLVDPSQPFPARFPPDPRDSGGMGVDSLWKRCAAAGIDEQRSAGGMSRGRRPSEAQPNHSRAWRAERNTATISNGDVAGS